MTQLLIQTTAPDFAAWKTAFDGKAEEIDTAGLNTLQIWTAEGSRVLVLFEVISRKRAEDWLAKEAALGQPLSPLFLETA